MQRKLISLAAIGLFAALGISSGFSQVPLEGTLFKVSGTSTNYLMKNGEKWQVISEAIFNAMGWQSSQVLSYSANFMGLYPAGPSFVTENSLIKCGAISGSTVYKIVSGQKRAYLNWNAFIQDGKHQEDILEVTATVYNVFPTGSMIQPTDPNAPQEGALVQIQGNSTVYLFKNMKKCPILNETMFNAMGWSFSNVSVYSASFLNQYPNGPTFVTDGCLIKGSSSTVYRIENNQRRPFINWDAFCQQNYHQEEIFEVTQAILNMFPTGTMINYTPPDVSQPNSTITGGPSGTIYELPVTFIFTGSDNVSPANFLDFSYKMDNGSWSSWQSVTSVTYTNLTEGQHTFYVKARDEMGNEETTPAERTFNYSPTITAPSNLTATAVSSSQINLNWQDNSTNELGFRIYRSLQPSGGFQMIASVGQNVVSYANTILNAGTTYYYYVMAYNANSESTPSNTASATTYETIPPPPANLLAEAISSSQINLTWQDNSANELGFRIYRSLQSGSGFQNIATVGQNVTSYSNTGLSAGVTYYYYVTAYNAVGESNPSNTANATTPTELNPYADAFDYPVGEPDFYNTNWYNWQDFGSKWQNPLLYHLGADLNKIGGDFGEPIYAPANSMVVYKTLGTTTDGWGMVLIIKCTAPSGSQFVVSNGKSLNFVYLMFAHMQTIEIHIPNGPTIPYSQIIENQTIVQKGWQIATVGDAYGQWSAHLHFEGKEIYNSAYPPGPGYALSVQGYFDPMEFIANNRVVPFSNENLSFLVHCYDTYDQNFSYFTKSSSDWIERHPEGESDTIGYNNHFYSHTTATDGYAKWQFSIPVAGKYRLKAFIPWNYATTTQAIYQIHYNNTQDWYTDPINQYTYSQAWALLGEFNFPAGTGNYVKLRTLTGENNYEIAADAVWAEYVDDGGMGGGPINNPPVLNEIGDQQVMAGGVLTFTISFTDEDGDLLFFSGENLPAAALVNQLDNNNASFEWQTTTLDTGCFLNVHFAVTDGALDDQENINITVEEPPVGIKERDFPENYLLLQNFPNPFNEEVKITYYLERESFITLRIYDLKGQICETLIASWQKPGKQIVSWRSANYPSGVYFCQFKTPTEVIIKKIVCLK